MSRRIAVTASFIDTIKKIRTQVQHLAAINQMKKQFMIRFQIISITHTNTNNEGDYDREKEI